MSNKNPGEPILTAPAPTEGIPTRRRLADNKPTTFTGKIKHNLQFIRGRGALEIGIVFAILFLAFVVLGILLPNDFPFVDPNNMSGVLTQSIPMLALLSVGVGILMISGEFDLSLGFAITFNAVVFVQVSTALGAFWGMIACVASGIMIALINGALVVFTKIPSFIATLGMGFFWGGASIFINGASSAQVPSNISDPNSWFEMLFQYNFGPFRSPLIWLIAFGVVAWFFLHRHKLGNHIYAVGGNANAARAISVNPTKVKLLSFGVYGFLVGLASLLFIARIPAIQPGGTATADFTLFAIAAAVVGGTSLNGGRGSIIGMIVGAALIEIIKNGLILAKAPGFYLQLFVGVTIVIAAIFNRIMEGKAS